MTSALQLNVSDTGEGDPILFIHGWLNDVSVWGGVIAELSSSHRCIAVDLRGHGASASATPGEYGRSFVLDDLRRVLDQAGVQSATVVGHSLGGYLGLALAIEDPSRVSALGLVAAGPGFRNPDSREQWNESVRSTAAKSDIPDGQEEISMHVDAMVLDRLAEITVPAAVVVGERDKRFLASAAVFAKRLQVKGETIVADAGHMVHVKQPAATAAGLRCVL